MHTDAEVGVGRERHNGEPPLTVHMEYHHSKPAGLTPTLSGDPDAQSREMVCPRSWLPSPAELAEGMRPDSPAVGRSFSPALDAVPKVKPHTAWRFYLLLFCFVNSQSSSADLPGCLLWLGQTC